MLVLGIGLNMAVLIWLIATLAYQYRPFAKRLVQIVPLQLLPRWTFFAPNPAVRDSHLLIRYELSDGSFGRWHTVPFAGPRSPLDCVWNPTKRPRKVLSDATQSLKVIRARNRSIANLQCTLPYLLLLRHCWSRPERPRDAISYQFAIVETSNRENRAIRLAFVSGLHKF
jgi:hypothetical protein